jgi:hypothetical protein
MTDSEPEIWYRFEDQDYSIADEYGDHSHTQYGVREIKFEVVKHTPKGVWLTRQNGFGGKRFVLNESTKRYACATREAAKESYVARKEKQIRIYRARINRAEHHIMLVGFK